MGRPESPQTHADGRELTVGAPDLLSSAGEGPQKYDENLNERLPGNHPKTMLANCSASWNIGKCHLYQHTMPQTLRQEAEREASSTQARCGADGSTQNSSL